MNKASVAEALLRFGETLQVGGDFTGEPEANALLRNDPFAFLMAASLDRGARAETVWELPWRLKQQLGMLEPAALARMTPGALEATLRQLPKKPRYPNQAAKTIVSLAQLVVSGEFNGNAAALWRGSSVVEVLAHLLRIWGVGTGIADMTLRILIDEGQYQPIASELHLIDIKPDTNVTRLFYRSGLSPSDNTWLCLKVARSLCPEFPAKLDWPAWEIGRRYCHAGKPDCLSCPLGAVCAKNLSA